MYKGNGIHIGDMSHIGHVCPSYKANSIKLYNVNRCE